MAQGLLAVDHGGHGSLLLTEASRAVLSGGETVHLRQMQAGKPKAATKRSTGTSTGLAAGLDPDAERRWQRLREWRSGIAKEHGVPAYVVFHDATLAELARSRPQSEAALAQVSGVGARNSSTMARRCWNCCATDPAARLFQGRASSSTTPATVSTAPSATRGGTRSCRSTSMLSASVNSG